jgi:hypothetical protein
MPRFAAAFTSVKSAASLRIAFEDAPSCRRRRPAGRARRPCAEPSCAARIAATYRRAGAEHDEVVSAAAVEDERERFSESLRSRRNRPANTPSMMRWSQETVTVIMRPHDVAVPTTGTSRIVPTARIAACGLMTAANSVWAASRGSRA